MGRHETVKAVFVRAKPEILFITKLDPLFAYFLELGTLGRQFTVLIIGCLERCFRHRLGELLKPRAACHQPELCKHQAAQPTDAHLHSLDICQRLDLPAVPVARLRAGIAGRNSQYVTGAKKLVHRRAAATEPHPGVLLPGVQTKRQGCTETELGVLADTEVADCLAAFNCGVLERIEHPQDRHDLAQTQNLDLKLVASQLRHALDDRIYCADKGIQRFRIA